MESRLLKRVRRLHSAVKEGDLAALIKVLRRYDTLELFQAYKEVYQTPILHLAIQPACYFGYDYMAYGILQTVLGALINAGADVNEPFGTITVTTPITEAIKNGDLDTVKLLVQFGADIKCSQRRKSSFFDKRRHASPLALATMYGGPDMVSYLLEQGVHPQKLDDKAGRMSSLARAVTRPAVGVLKVFMDWYRANNRDFPWLKLIHVAFMTETEDAVVAILKRGYHLFCEDDTCFKEIFVGSLSAKFINVLRLLIQQQPQHAHKTWMRQIIEAENLISINQSDFLAWFHNLRSQPFSLQIICKTEILRVLGSRQEEVIKQLPLPAAINDFLLAENKL